jgi:hypothetical protein
VVQLWVIFLDVEIFDDVSLERLLHGSDSWYSALPSIRKALGQLALLYLWLTTLLE